MKSYKETKEELLKATDYRNFTYRMTRLPEMIEAQSKKLDEILAQFKEEGFNHLSVVELCRAFVRIDLIRLSLMQSTHGVLDENKKVHYPSELEVFERFTMEKTEQDFYPLDLPKELEDKNQEIRELITNLTKELEPLLRLVEQNTGDMNETLKIVIGELQDANNHVLSKIYDDVFYTTVLDYNVDNAFENTWKKNLIQSPLVSFYSMFTLSYYDDMFKEQLV